MNYSTRPAPTCSSMETIRSIGWRGATLLLPALRRKTIFECEEISAVIYDLMINIKANRGERPNIGTIYQSALALIGDQGGWLNHVWTPMASLFGAVRIFHQHRVTAGPDFPTGESGRRNIQAYPDCVQKNVEALREGLADNIVRTFAGEPTRNFFSRH